MVKAKLADYIFKRAQEAGVEYTFGIPGDFVLPVYAAQERAGMKTAVMTHEPSVGFAADAYARLKGLGVALVTYGAGGLNMVNPIAAAYAEESPVLVISGSPETRFRDQKPELHHCVKTFDTQYRVYREISEVQTILGNPEHAQAEIDRVFDTVMRKSRPGYIEIPRDLVNQELVVNERAPASVGGQSPALNQAIEDILAAIKQAERPVIFAGAQIRRFKLDSEVVALSEAGNLPVVTSILGKSAFPETHPNFIGTYFGQFGNPKVRQYVESSDCVICLGVVLTEMETGGYTANLDPSRLIQMTSSAASVGYRSYEQVDFACLVRQLLNRLSGGSGKRFSIPEIEPEEHDSCADRKELTVLGMVNELNQMLSEKYMIVSDVGDCLYAGLGLRTNTFIAPGYYSTMGFGVPAGIGAQLADRRRRPIVLVGDGGFQMTGMEISSAVRLGLNPIVIVFNNATYGMLRFVDQRRDYYRLAEWDYASLAKAVGGQGVQAGTRAEFASALKEAEASKGLCLIEAKIEADDISPTLKRLTDHFGKKVKAAIS